MFLADTRIHPKWMARIIYVNINEMRFPHTKLAMWKGGLNVSKVEKLIFWRTWCGWSFANGIQELQFWWKKSMDSRRGQYWKINIIWLPCRRLYCSAHKLFNLPSILPPPLKNYRIGKIRICLLSFHCI